MMISPSATKTASLPESATSAPEPVRKHKRSLLLGLLPFIGVILFAISAAQTVMGGRPADWKHQLALAAVVYLIGWSALGAGISHIFFGKAISGRSDSPAAPTSSKWASPISASVSRR